MLCKHGNEVFMNCFECLSEKRSAENIHLKNIGDWDDVMVSKSRQAVFFDGVGVINWPPAGRPLQFNERVQSLSKKDQNRILKAIEKLKSQDDDKVF
jgi:hypothetical protein